MLEKSFHDAVKALTMGTSQSALIRARERAYVKTLVGHLQREFDAEDLRVFAPSQRGNAADFGTNDLLYAIAVCRIGRGATSARKSEEFLYVAEALWQIEVAFSREWRKALFGLNRLNCGAAADKLLVISAPEGGRERLLRTFRAAAAAGGGLHLAFVPHPADWDDAAGAPEVWRLAKGDWEELT